LAPEKRSVERPSVRPAMCERSPLGLPHTQIRMPGCPRVAEILLMSSPQTPRVCGDLKTRPKFVGSDSWGQIFCQLSETEREHEEEGRAGGRGAQLRYARGSRASRVCARTSTYPRTGIPAGPVRTLAWLQGRCARSLPGDPCAQLILLTRIAVPVQWRCRQSESRNTHHGRMSWTPRGFQLLQLSLRSMDSRARATCRSWTRMIC